MPDGGGGCDLACRTKIIINGDNVANLVETVCKQIEYARDHDLPLLKGRAMILLLNQMENDANKLQRLLLDSFNYSGPTGAMTPPSTS